MAGRGGRQATGRGETRACRRLGGEVGASADRADGRTVGRDAMVARRGRGGAGRRAGGTGAKHVAAHGAVGRGAGRGARHAGVRWRFRQGAQAAGGSGVAGAARGVGAGWIF